MSPAEAIDYASLSKETAYTPEHLPAAITKGIPLTRREQEVANLLERRFTSRQIASELHLSERTVDKHVANILRKLNLHSREQVGAKMTRQRSHPF